MGKTTRREFLGETSTALVLTGAVSALEAEPAATALLEPFQQAERSTVPRTAIQLTVNGTQQRVEVEDRWTLVETLRDHLNLTGTKVGCDRSECGACTVLLNGKPIYSCTFLAVWANGQTVQTVEGLATGDRLDPLQQAFIDHDGPQCGYCTSGQLMSAKALLTSNPRPTADQVKNALTGNLCRCSNYNRYVESVLAAAAGTRQAGISLPREGELS